MKRAIQKTGVRTYFGDDFIELQSEPLNAIDAILAAAGPCVISGCEVAAVGGKFNISTGFVALQTTDQATGAAHIMVMPFDGAAGVTLPIYLVANCTVVERPYKDGAVKPIAYNYKATATALKPAGATSIEVTEHYTRRLPDALVESLAKYSSVTEAEKAVWSAKESPAGAQSKADAAQTAAQTAAIAAAAADATTKANAAQTAAIVAAKTYTDNNKYTHPDNANTRHVTDAEKSTWSAKETTTGAQSKADAAQTAAIGAAKTYTDNNKYTHPDNANTRHVTDAEKSTWNAKETTTGAQSKADAAQAAAIGAAKTYTDNNKYTHPDNANTRHVTDVEKSTWNAKETTAGAQSKADAAQAAAIGEAATDATTKASAAQAAAIGAAKTYTDNNKYTHPDNANTRHVTDAEKTAWNGKVNAEEYNGMRSVRNTNPQEYDASRVTPDGFWLMRGRNGASSLPVKITYDGIEISTNHVFDMPGFLCRMRYSSTGTLLNRYGAKSVSKNAGRVGVGRYKIYHSIASELYTPTLIPIVSIDGRNVYLPCLIDRGYDSTLGYYYCTVGFSDSSNGNWVDVGFEVIINGQN